MRRSVRTGSEDDRLALSGAKTRLIQSLSCYYTSFDPILKTLCSHVRLFFRSSYFLQLVLDYGLIALSYHCIGLTVVLDHVYMYSVLCNIRLLSCSFFPPTFHCVKGYGPCPLQLINESKISCQCNCLAIKSRTLSLLQL